MILCCCQVSEAQILLRPSPNQIEFETCTCTLLSGLYDVSLIPGEEAACGTEGIAALIGFFPC